MKSFLSMSWRHTRSGGLAPIIHNLITEWRWAVYVTSRPTYPQEITTVAHGTGGGLGPRADLVVFGEKTYLFIPGLEPRTSIPYSVTIPPELPRFRTIFSTKACTYSALNSGLLKPPSTSKLTICLTGTSFGGLSATSCAPQALLSTGVLRTWIVILQFIWLRRSAAIFRGRGGD